MPGQTGEIGRVRRLPALAVLAVSCFFVLAIVEAASRLLIPNRYFVWPPNFSARFDAGGVITHGVAFPGELTINAAGMRGDLPSDATEYQILAVGGSTTICVYLDDARAWPYLLQQKLNRAIGREAVWVGNVGRPGHNTVQHILQVEKLIDQDPDIDLVVLLLGINDLIAHLSSVRYPEQSLVPNAHQKLVMSFSFFPGWDDDTPWFERNLIGRVRRLSSWRPLPGTSDLQPMDEKGRFVASLRGFRQRAGEIRTILPDLSAGRTEYAARLREIAEIARRRGVRILFMTQPTLWSGSLSVEQRRLLWAGGPPLHKLRDGATYLAVEALAEGMAQFNETLLSVCREENIECLDVAARIEHSPAMMYDDAHFTDRGSALLASMMADYLLEEGRLTSKSPSSSP